MQLRKWLLNKYSIIIYILLFIIIRFLIGYYSTSTKDYTVLKIKNYTEDLIINSVNDALLNNLDSSSFFTKKYDNNGKVSYAYLDTKKINLVRNRISEYSDYVIGKINNHVDLNSIEVPIGYFFGTKMLFDKDLSIPIDLEVLGNQNITIKSQVIENGINTTIIEVYLNYSIEVLAIIPYKKIKIICSTNIPLSMEIMNNEIPYYLGDI